MILWYGVEYGEDFVYLALERCTCSLDDLIQINQTLSQGQATTVAIEYITHLDKVKCIMEDLKLWELNGYPSPHLLSLMR